MRLLRLRLANFRGIEAREVRFAPVGVTIVSGPNEAGKTSLLEALDLLLGFRDESRDARVRDTQPIGRDVATEIELEAECGPYAFVYRKHFHRNRLTELEIRRPRPERVVGREAHERVDAILRETADLDLWQALRVQQGVALGRPALGAARSLAAALDAAAGGDSTGTAEESLFERVQKEHAALFTKAGKPRGELEEAEREEREASAASAEAHARLRALEADVERAQRLDETLVAEERGRSELAQRALETRKDAEAAEALRGERDRLALGHEAAAGDLRAAEAALRTRELLVAASEERRRERDRLAQASVALAPALEVARAARASREARAREAAERSSAATAARERARSESDRARARHELSRLEAVRRELETARAEDSVAADLLAKTRIDERRLAAIRAAESALVAAWARLEATAPSVSLRALAPGEIVVDGAAVALARDEERRVPVAGSLSLEVPGRLALRVEAGAGGSRVLDALADAERALADRCAEAGVATPAEAAEAELRRLDALRRRESFARLLAARLGGEGRTPRELEDRIEALRARAGDPASGAPEPEAAEGALRDAETALLEAEVARADAERERDAARERAEGLEKQAAESVTKLRVAESELERASADLARARAAAPDDALIVNVRAAQRRAGESERALREIEARLGALDAKAARDRAEVAERAVAGADARLRSCRSERDALQGALGVRAEQGLYESASSAGARHLHAARRLAGLRRRAAAARRLFDALAEARAEARRAYAAPLREGIERLGRYVFGPDFAVELDDDLAVATRILGGVPVPFDQLSGGAREQLALLARVAAAELVARDGDGPAGAMPLVLDDALGYTDATRLAELGAVLAIAGRRLQIVVLTCQPERWRHVGGAHEVRL
ncbi:MAG TPA: AAA family ATPase [Myxococcota bacterium]|nr:AAA family ATPase [Myxococcota bacterium]